MHLVHKIIFSIWIYAVAVNSVTNEANSEIVQKDERPIYATYNTCGGYVESKIDQLVVLEYKPDEEYNNDEFCVWKIRLVDCVYSLITKTASGFEAGYDFLQISSFHFVFDPPTGHHLMGNTTGIEQINVEGRNIFLIFSTDDSNIGTGFRLEIVGYSSGGSNDYEDFVTFSPIGRATLRPYGDYISRSYLIVPPLKIIGSLVLDLEFVTEDTFDYLSVYSMERNGQTINFRQHARRLSGNGTASFRTDNYANFVVFFDSNYQNVPEDGGYELNWYVPDGPTTDIYLYTHHGHV